MCITCNIGRHLAWQHMDSILYCILAPTYYLKQDVWSANYSMILSHQEEPTFFLTSFKIFHEMFIGHYSKQINVKSGKTLQGTAK